MRAIASNDRAAELRRAAAMVRDHFPELANAFERVAELQRRIEEMENMRGLWRYLSAGGRKH